MHRRSIARRSPCSHPVRPVGSTVHRTTPTRHTTIAARKLSIQEILIVRSIQLEKEPESHLPLLPLSELLCTRR